MSTSTRSAPVSIGHVNDVDDDGDKANDFDVKLIESKGVRRGGCEGGGGGVDGFDIETVADDNLGILIIFDTDIELNAKCSLRDRMTGRPLPLTLVNLPAEPLVFKSFVEVLRDEFDCFLDGNATIGLDTCFLNEIPLDFFKELTSGVVVVVVVVSLPFEDDDDEVRSNFFEEII